MTRFIFITGGVVSSLGKGLASAALGALLQASGFKVRLRKLDANYDPSDSAAALQHIMKHEELGEEATGLLYLNVEDTELKEKMDIVNVPLNSLGVTDLRPDSKKLESINKSLR